MGRYTGLVTLGPCVNLTPQCPQVFVWKIFLKYFPCKNLKFFLLLGLSLALEATSCFKVFKETHVLEVGDSHTCLYAFEVFLLYTSFAHVWVLECFWLTFVNIFITREDYHLPMRGAYLFTRWVKRWITLSLPDEKCLSFYPMNKKMKTLLSVWLR